MNLEQAQVVAHGRFAGNYRILELASPVIASCAAPGQFVHLRVPDLDIAVLRRPFSVYRAEAESFSILYKQVGLGTAAMMDLVPGLPVSLIGPLGNGFACDRGDTFPLLVGGGYGVAPLSFLASRMQARGCVFIGGACADDILCAEDFRELGWEVSVTTEDGSGGRTGLVTDALDEWFERRCNGSDPELYACGPDGMLQAVGERAVAAGCKAWLSLDKHMGCGVGACLACVQRIREDDGTVVWKRVCKDGPVFEAREIVWGRAEC